MLKRLLGVMVCGSCSLGCGGSAGTVATTTPLPPPTTEVPTITSPPVRLVDELHLATETATAYSLDWSVDGEALAVASGVEVTVLPKDLGEPIAVFKPTGGAIAAAWNPERTNVATVGGLRNRTIEVWEWQSAGVDLSTPNKVAAESDQFAVSWSPDGTHLATLANDRTSTIQIWDTTTWTVVHQFDLPYTNPRRALNWSADGQSIDDAGESNGHAVYFSMNVADGSVHELGSLPIQSVVAFTFSPDLQRIAVADEGGKVQIFDVASGGMLAEFDSVSSPADLAWNPKHSTLAVLGYDASLQLWSLAL